jgi:ABC-type transporter Mla subunit MlaD
MQLKRNEIRTGLLVIGTIAVLAFVLIVLGAPGIFRSLVTYRIYVDNAAGIKLGAPVMLAGRKIGQVAKLYSPVSREEEQRAHEVANAYHQGEASPTPTPADAGPKYEARIDVQADKGALVYRDAHARLIQLGLLGDMAIDITQGTESSGRARDGEIFAGERVPDFSEAAARMLEVIKPVAAEATSTMQQLSTTAQNLNQLTAENSQLDLAMAQFRTFGEHLVDLTAPTSPLSMSLKNVQKISDALSANNNLAVTLQNFRDSSEKLKTTMRNLEPVGENVKEFSETIRTQPWRLIWPSTKKYPEKPERAPGEQTITVRKSAKAKATPSPRGR